MLATEPTLNGPIATVSQPDAISTLTTHNLRKRYKKRTVVQDASIEVRSGEVVGLLSPNGAGKTTCFYMVVGLVACDGGDVYLDDRKITHRLSISVPSSVFPICRRKPRCFSKLTVIENIKSVLELRKLPASEVDQQAEQLLEELHVGHIRK